MNSFTPKSPRMNFEVSGQSSSLLYLDSRESQADGTAARVPTSLDR